MTDAERRDAAVVFLQQTTVGWAKVVTYSPAKYAATNWAKAMAQLALIGTYGSGAYGR